MIAAHPNKSIKTSSKTKTSIVSSYREYIALTKPGIIRGNVVTALAGYLLASNGTVDWLNCLMLVIGTSAIIASACVCNNILDRRIDRLMKRTRDRALAMGRITVHAAAWYAAALGICGVLVLAFGTNLLTTSIGIFGFIAYVALYGYAKRRSVYGTHVGSISGALPPVAGYTAATNSFTLTAVLLFLILVFWQMAHFFSIGLYRKSDYSTAHIPTMPVLQSAPVAKRRILGYIAAYGIVSLGLTLHGDVGIVYSVAMSGLIAVWLYKGLRSWSNLPAEQWGKRMFLFSLVALLLQSLLLGGNWVLP